MSKYIKKPSKKIISDFKNNKLEFSVKDSMYSIFSEYYDQIMSNLHYDSWFCYLKDIFDRFNVNPSRVLDIACGTAAVLIYFSMNGYDARGVDISPGMLKQARSKHERMNLPSNLHLGDMITYKSDDKFDLVYLLNDSINYIINSESLDKFFCTTYNLLVDDGLLIFDASTELNMIKNFTYPIYKEYDTFSFLWANDYVKKTRLVVSYLDFLIYETLEVVREIHIQNIFSQNDIIQSAKLAGFNNINVFHGFSFEKPRPNTEILHFVMKK